MKKSLLVLLGSILVLHHLTLDVVIDALAILMKHLSKEDLNYLNTVNYSYMLKGRITKKFG